MKEHLEEMEFMRWVVIQKFDNKELDADSLSRMIVHIASLSYQAGRKHERKFMEVDKMNNVSLVGRLTKDVDLRYTQNGKAVANFNIAVNRPFKNASGEQEADFINCQSWGRDAENLANYMKKGNQIGLVGRIQTRNYENNEGNRVFVTEVVADNVQFLESKKQSNNQQSQSRQQNNDQFKGQVEAVDISDQELPF